MVVFLLTNIKLSRGHLTQNMVCTLFEPELEEVAVAVVGTTSTMAGPTPSMRSRLRTLPSSAPLEEGGRKG